MLGVMGWGHICHQRMALCTPFIYIYICVYMCVYIYMCVYVYIYPLDYLALVE